jgi:transposase InsO family protein
MHLAESAGMDFFTIPTVVFGVHLYGFVVIRHRDPCILHLNVTRHPTAKSTKRQLLEAFSYDQVPSHLHRDRDRIYGEVVTEAIANLGIIDKPSALRSPWQNPYAERVIGSIRRDLLDHCIVLNEAHARTLLRSWEEYYHSSRTHLGLDKDVLMRRPVQNAECGATIVEIEEVFGLHHRYERCAA